MRWKPLGRRGRPGCRRRQSVRKAWSLARNVLPLARNAGSLARQAKSPGVDAREPRSRGKKPRRRCPEHRRRCSPPSTARQKAPAAMPTSSGVGAKSLAADAREPRRRCSPASIAGQERLHCRPVKFTRVPRQPGPDIPANPVQVRLLGPQAVVLEPHPPPHLLQQARLAACARPRGYGGLLAVIRHIGASMPPIPEGWRLQRHPGTGQVRDPRRVSRIDGGPEGSHTPRYTPAGGLLVVRRSDDHQAA